MAMNPEIKAQWTAALRSGKYEQGAGYLRRTVNGTEKYCCLGVLCELAVKAGIIRSARNIVSNSMDYDGSSAFLPGRVQLWAGITRKDPAGLTSLNDSGVPFTRIAGVIDDQL